MGWRLFIILIVGSVFCACVSENTGLSEKELLGKALFFDENLSEPAGQSCATCHTVATGFADKYSRTVSEGAVKGRFSNRNSMSCAYTAYIPGLYYNEEDETYVGGLFWDGRVNTLEEQAGEPFLNLVEMGNTSSKMVVDKVKKSDYYVSFVRIYGEVENVDTFYARITNAIAAYERSIELNPFSSKYDAYLSGNYTLTEEEERGLKLFEDKGMCAECHILDKDERAGRVLFTDHTYDNLGIPENPENPFYRVSAQFNPHGRDTVDLGLGGALKDPNEYGKFRVPTLRNIALTAPYGHNGYFKTLEDIVHFYNVRDIEGNYPAPEYPETINKDELGNLGLTADEEAAIVAFMYTLTDGYMEDKCK